MISVQQWCICYVLCSALCCVCSIDPFQCNIIKNVTSSVATKTSCSKYGWDKKVSKYLEPYHLNGISEVTIQRAEDYLLSLRGGFGGFKVIISGYDMFVKPIGQMKLDRPEGDLMLMLLSKLLVYKMSQLNVEFIVHIFDKSVVRAGSRLPIFGWARTNNEEEVLLPNHHTFAFINNAMQEIKRIQKPWEFKRPVAYFRGSTVSGRILEKDNWDNFTRAKLVDMCHEMKDICEADFNSIVQATPEAAKKLRDKYDVVRQLPLAGQLRYKYLIAPDGNGPTGRTVEYYHSNSLVLKQRSDMMEFFYDMMVPGVHNIELAKDFSDLREKVLWLREHDDEARAIAQAAQELASSYLTDASITCYMHQLLSSYQSLMKYTPVVSEDMRRYNVKGVSRLRANLEKYYTSCP